MTAGTRDHGYIDFGDGASSRGEYGSTLTYSGVPGYLPDAVTLGGAVRLAGVATLGPLELEALTDEAPLEGVLVRPSHRGTLAAGRKAERYTGRHASPRRKTARNWRAGRVVPVAVAAAALAAGATAAVLLLGSGGHSQPAEGNAAIGLPGKALIAQAPGANAAAAAALVPVAQGTASASVARKKAAPRPSASPRASASAKPSAPATAAPASHAPAPKALSCDLNYSMLPANVTAIVSFLLANGYSDNAAAGIAGNIYQESKGNPESVGTGGGGLIGWTPLPAGFVTGNVSADLERQLGQILVYNQGWASYIPELNAAATPADAAYIYVTDFERAGIPAAYNRETSASEVAKSCGI